ncbi:hypothetical protein HU200_011034 [Digitaria exilis]|uniref:Uncharacterized protein n=1 Tax=Digitaria exilis TaxID=1010633 RepID=A0A835KN27_9POAL|nr:hypothetical protein HU200_011034 [Digitaria exilis]
MTVWLFVNLVKGIGPRRGLDWQSKKKKTPPLKQVYRPKKMEEKVQEKNMDSKKEWRVKKNDQPKPVVQAVQPVVQAVQTASSIEPPAQPVRLVEAKILPDDVSSARMVCDDELTSNNPRFVASDGVPLEATIVGFRGTSAYRRSDSLRLDSLYRRSNSLSRSSDEEIPATARSNALSQQFFKDMGLDLIFIPPFSLDVQLECFKLVLHMLGPTEQGMYLTIFNRNNSSDYDADGCIPWLNDFAEEHNRALRLMLERIVPRDDPTVTIIYGDYYGAILEITLLRPRHISWDGIHLTEAAYQFVARGMLDGTYAAIIEHPSSHHLCPRIPRVSVDLADCPLPEPFDSPPESTLSHCPFPLSP